MQRLHLREWHDCATIIIGFSTNLKKEERKQTRTRILLMLGRFIESKPLPWPSHVNNSFFAMPDILIETQMYYTH